MDAPSRHVSIGKIGADWKVTDVADYEMVINDFGMLWGWQRDSEVLEAPGLLLREQTACWLIEDLSLPYQASVNPSMTVLD